MHSDRYADTDSKTLMCALAKRNRHTQFSIVVRSTLDQAAKKTGSVRLGLVAIHVKIAGRRWDAHFDAIKLFGRDDLAPQPAPERNQGGNEVMFSGRTFLGATGPQDG
jgi:hypothetical protein